MPLGRTPPRTRVYRFHALCERTTARVSCYETIVIGLEQSQYHARLFVVLSSVNSRMRLIALCVYVTDKSLGDRV